jgi:hypothetical protein
MLKKISLQLVLLCPVIVIAQNNVGIGTTSPTERLHVAGNIRADTLKTTSLRLSGSAPAAGKVLTSDANGNASWQTPAGGGGTLTDAYNFGGPAAGRIINATTGSLRVDGNYGFQVFGSSSSLSLEDPGPGNRMFFSASNAAFRSGVVSIQNIWSGNNLGYASSAMGFNSNAAGAVAFAAGNTVNANGENSIAMGLNVVSNADRSATFGFNNINNGYGSLVVGRHNDTIYAKQTTLTAGTAMFVVGNGNSNFSRSNAMVVLNNGRTGLGTNIPSEKLEVEGNVLADTIKTSIVRITGGTPGAGKVLTSDATGNATWQTPAGGGGTLTDAYNFGGAGAGRIINAATASLRVDGNYGLQVYGQLGTQFVDNPGVGSRMFFNPGEATFRAGYLNTNFINLWNKDSVGLASIAMGSNSNAYSNYGIAIGVSTIARGINAVSIGNSNNAVGESSGAIGELNTTSGERSIAIGLSNLAEGQYSFAGGRNSYAKGISALALGEGSDALGNYSVAIGRNNLALGTTAVAIGNVNRANATNSYCIGEGLVGNGWGSFNVGRYNDTLYPVQSSISSASAIFTVGYGTGAGVNARRNALTVLNNGITGINLSNPRSTLDVNGTLALANVSFNTAFATGPASQASVAFFSGSGEIGLPAAASCEGRIYILVNQTAATKLFNNFTYINFSGASVNSMAANSGIKIISDGTSWRLIP